jgi:hypothetical protein
VKDINFREQMITFNREPSKDNKRYENGKLPKDFEEITPKIFEEFARRKLSAHFNTELNPREIKNGPKLFDFVSPDFSIIGDAKYYKMLGEGAIPPAKFSTIAEHVWMLEKINAKRKFLVFGNDRRVPEKWLEKYGNLVSDVEFFFLDVKSNKLEELKKVDYRKNQNVSSAIRRTPQKNDVKKSLNYADYWKIKK